MTTAALHHLPRTAEHDLDEVLAAWQAARPRLGVLAALLEDGAFRTRGAWLLRLDERPYAALHSDLPREPEKIPAAMGALVEDLKPHFRRQGCDTMQSYYFSRPVPADDIARPLRNGSRRPVRG